MADKVDVTGGSFHRLGQALQVSIIAGAQPQSVIFRVLIDPGEIEPYTIEYFALPGTAMALLQLLEAVRQHEGYPMPEGTIEPKSFQ